MTRLLTVLLDDHDLHGARRAALVAQVEDDLSYATRIDFVWPDGFTLSVPDCEGACPETVAAQLVEQRKAYRAA